MHNAVKNFEEVLAFKLGEVFEDMSRERLFGGWRDHGVTSRAV